MTKAESVYREILYQAMEKNNRTLTQSYLAKALKLSLSTVNLAVKHLVKMNAVRVKNRSFDVIDVKKILYYWASVRNLEKDIIYQTRVDKEIRKIESEMPPDTVYTAYSGYRFMFKDAAADYSEVYVYCDDLAEIKKRFPPNNNQPNMFVLKNKPEKLTIAQLFVDLWNLKEWYAKDFLKELEDKYC